MLDFFSHHSRDQNGPDFMLGSGCNSIMLKRPWPCKGEYDSNGGSEDRDLYSEAEVDLVTS
jgi:hypothetical protein